MNILGSIGYNLRNLARFRGRDSRSRFWPYAIVIVVLTSIAAAKVMMPEMMSSVERVHRFAIENPDKASIERHQGGYTVHLRGFYPDLMPRIDQFLPGLAAVSFIGAALLAAATVRRLHDCGKAAAWIALPIFLLATGFIIMYEAFSILLAGQFEFKALHIALFVALMANNIAYLGSTLYLVAALTKPGPPDESAYGPEPTSPA